MGLSELWAPLFLLPVYPSQEISERSLRAQLLLGDHPLHIHTHTHTRLVWSQEISERSLRAQLLLGDTLSLSLSVSPGLQVLWVSVWGGPSSSFNTHTLSWAAGPLGQCVGRAPLLFQGVGAILSPWLKVHHSHPHQALCPDLLFYSSGLFLHDLGHL